MPGVARTLSYLTNGSEAEESQEIASQLKGCEANIYFRDIDKRKQLSGNLDGWGYLRDSDELSRAESDDSCT
jgi:hypothetical protein